MSPEVNNIQIEDATWIQKFLPYIVNGKCSRDKSEAQKLNSKLDNIIFLGAVISKVFFGTFVRVHRSGFNIKSNGCKS